ncbi:hypothetical protein LTR74_008717 [Friedmanniomyces endolithicus]|nr:hypothetical protein LTR74_008717 [Friedmanniomyces endolithicus]
MLFSQLHQQDITSWYPFQGFLSLPRELRDNVYELVAISEQSLVVKTEPPTANRCQLASRSRLILTCKQLHNEYLENFLANILKPGPRIKIGVTVTDLDFTRAFQFLCQLTHPQRIATVNQVDLKIKLVFREPEEPSSRYPRPYHDLNRWCVFCKAGPLKPQYYIKNMEVGPHVIEEAAQMDFRRCVCASADMERT